MARLTKARSIVEARDPFGAGMEVELERPFDRDLSETEVRGRIDPADDNFALLPILDDLAGRAVLEVGQQPQDVTLAFEGDLAALGTQALAQRRPERRGVDELNLAAAHGPFAVRNHPDVGRDSRVVEELLGQRDQGFEQVVLEDPAANLALAAAGVAGEERRAVHDDRHSRPALGRPLDVRHHVQQEQELAVADPRQARPEASGGATVVFVPHGVLIALPVLAVGRIGDHVVEGAARVPVVREGAAEEDVLRVAPVDRLHETGPICR